MTQVMPLQTLLKIRHKKLSQTQYAIRNTKYEIHNPSSHHHLNRRWQNFHGKRPDIRSKSGKYFPVNVNVKWSAGLQLEFAKLAHAHLRETSVSSVHNLRNQAEHHWP